MSYLLIKEKAYWSSGNGRITPKAGGGAIRVVIYFFCFFFASRQKKKIGKNNFLSGSKKIQFLILLLN